MKNKLFEVRPWGNFKVLSEDKNYKVKKITVNSNARLSLQRHKYRQEHWFVISGEGIVTLDNKQINITVGDSVNIPLMSKHRIENRSQNELVFVEIQTGQSFDESDIERFEDDYNRINDKSN